MNVHQMLAVLSAVLLVLSPGRADQAATDAAWGGQTLLGSYETSSSYVLGPDDEITIRAPQMQELNDKAMRVDLSGNLRLPVIGLFKVAGMTTEGLESALAERMKGYVLKPDVSVSVTQFRSQPVSVLGAVRNPGLYQLQGRKMLIEVLSLAGGLDKDTAGSSVKITRRIEMGRIPLEGVRDDPSGKFTTAEVDLRSILHAENAAANIVLKPYDVITVPRADLIYVVGQVLRSGGFVLNERKTMTLLEALSQAGGIDRAAAPQHSRILRRVGDSAERKEIAVNVRKILSGESPDMALLPNDILFIPSSLPKRAALRSLEAAIQLGTGIAIWRR